MPTLRSGNSTLTANPIAPPHYTPRQAREVCGGGGGGSTVSVPRRIKTDLVRQFDSYVHDAMLLKPFTSENGFKFVGILGNGVISNNLKRLVRGEFHCSMCSSHANLLMRMVGSNTSEGGFCQHYSAVMSPNQRTLHTRLHEIYKRTHTSPRGADDIKLLLLPSDSYVPRSDDDPAIATLRSYIGSTTETTPGHKFYGETFLHYNYSGEKCGMELNDQIYKAQRALDKYVPLIDSLMSPLTMHDLRSINDSLKLLINDILPSATYASRLNHGVRWFNSILEQMKNSGAPSYAAFTAWNDTPLAKKIEIIGKAVLGEKIAIDETDGEVTVTAYHQLIGSVFNVLQMGGNRDRIIRTLEARYCPEKYMQTTKAPTVGKIQNAIAALGDYKCRLHTVYSLAAAKAPILQLRGSPLTNRHTTGFGGGGGGGGVTSTSVSGGGSGGGGGGSMDAMMELLAENVVRKKESKFALAKRLHAENERKRREINERYEREQREINERIERENRLRINSMTELMDRIRTGEIWELKVDSFDREVVWFGGFEGGKIGDMLVTGNNWGWQYTKEVKVFGKKKIWGIVPIDNLGGFTNWIFIYDKEGARNVPKLKAPIYWPGILRTEYFKKFGEVFKSVGQKSQVLYPISEENYNHPAIGCGVTRDTTSRLVRPINVYINGSSTPRYIYYA